MRDADVAAGCLRAEAAGQDAEIAAVLLGGRDLGDMIAAVDTDGVLAEAVAVVFDGAAAGNGDELAGRGFAMQILRRRKAGRNRAGADARAVLEDGQRLLRLIDDQAVVHVRLGNAELVGADVAADESAVLVAEGLDQRPAVRALNDDVQTLRDAGNRAELLAAVGNGIIDVSGFALTDVHAGQLAGDGGPDLLVGCVGGQAPVTGVFLSGGIGHAHADQQAFIAHHGFAGMIGDDVGRRGRGGSRDGNGGDRGRGRGGRIARSGRGVDHGIQRRVKERKVTFVLRLADRKGFGEGVGGDAELGHHIDLQGILADGQQITGVVLGVVIENIGLGVHLGVILKHADNVAAGVEQLDGQEAGKAGRNGELVKFAASRTLSGCGHAQGRLLGKGLAGRSQRDRVDAQQYEADRHGKHAAEMLHHNQIGSFRYAQAGNSMRPSVH